MEQCQVTTFKTFFPAYTYFSKKHIIDISFTQSRRNKISYHGRILLTILVIFAKFYKCVIIKLKFYMVVTTTSSLNCVQSNIPWFQFVKHANRDLDTKIGLLKLFKQCNSCHVHNVLAMICINASG